MLPDHFTCKTLILGCGNILMGDDGFGPAVANALIKDPGLSSEVCVLDVGTSVREILFDLVLSESRPDTVVIVDAVDHARKPGELFYIDISAIPVNKVSDFSMHQVPSSNLLRELRDLCNVNVFILVCQVSSIPEEVAPGLSEPVQNAVERAVQLLKRDFYPVLVPDSKLHGSS